MLSPLSTLRSDNCSFINVIHNLRSPRVAFLSGEGFYSLYTLRRGSTVLELPDPTDDRRRVMGYIPTFCVRQKLYLAF